MREIAQEADCPFLQAGADDGDYLLSSTKGAFSPIGVAKPGKVKEAYAAVLREAKRMHDFGFTATEYQRAKEEFMSQVDKTLANKDKMKNEQFTTQYVDNFTSNEPIPSVEDESQIYKMVVPQLAIGGHQCLCQAAGLPERYQPGIDGADARGRGCRLSYRAGACRHREAGALREAGGIRGQREAGAIDGSVA